MADTERRFSTEEISKYISGFSTSEAREAAIRELMTGKMLADALETPNGKLVLASVVDAVRDNMMKIVRLSVAGFDDNFAEIKQAAFQINVAYDFMHRIASTLMTGEAHEKGIKA